MPRLATLCHLNLTSPQPHCLWFVPVNPNWMPIVWHHTTMTPSIQHYCSSHITPPMPIQPCVSFTTLLPQYESNLTLFHLLCPCYTISNLVRAMLWHLQYCANHRTSLQSPDISATFPTLPNLATTPLTMFSPFAATTPFHHDLFYLITS